MAKLIILMLILVSTITGALGSMYLKHASKKFNFNILKQLKNWYLYAAFLMYVVGTLSYIYALSIEKLSILYPLTSLTYIWVYLLSHNILKEHISYRKWFGMSLIIVGIVLIMLIK